MPSSYFEQIPIIIDILLRLRPSSILDLGVGFGKYGFLAREYLEVWGENKKVFGKFQLRIDGVEGFKDYITPCHNYIYDNIYIEDIVNFSKKQTASYDVVLMIDVLEHINKNDGISLIQNLTQKNRNVIIATPSKFHKQGASFSNPLEIHRSYWHKRELSTFGKTIHIPFKNSTIVVIGRDVDLLKKYRLKRLLYEILPGFFQRFI